MNEVCRQRQFTPAPVGRSVDGGDNRNRTVHSGVIRLFEDRVLLAPRLIRHAVSFLEIPAGTERLVPGSGDDDCPQALRIEQELREQGQEVSTHLCIERVGHLRPVERDPQHVLERMIAEYRFKS